MALVFLALFVFAAGLGVATSFDAAAGAHATSAPPQRAFGALAPRTPTRLRIAAIMVDAPLTSISAGPDGTGPALPSTGAEQVGWFADGPTPGELGPAVIVGPRTGSSAFVDLGRLRPGNRIEVDRADASTAIFTVTSVEHSTGTALPVQHRYGDYQRPSLRLIAYGSADAGTAVDTVIVFAALTSSLGA